MKRARAWLIGLGTIYVVLLPSASAVAAERGPPEIDLALSAWASANGSPPDALSAYGFSFADLNDDNTPEAIVMLTGPYCGSGGCTILVMRRQGAQLKVLSKSTITREPICIATERRHGWRSLIVRVAGGGLSTFDAILRFDGQQYPLNPSMQPHASEAALQSCQILELKRVEG